MERFMIINGHGGNIAPLGNALVRINEELGPTFVGSATYFSFADKDLGPKFDFDKDIVGHAARWKRRSRCTWPRKSSRPTASAPAR
ncbi:MAG: hypothetical protein R2849_02135 [Thermomicrobiales bacterium]